MTTAAEHERRRGRRRLHQLGHDGTGALLGGHVGHALVGEGLLLGLSVSTLAEALAAPAGVDYLGVGPVWTTPTKPLAAAPLGVDGLAAVVGATALPCVAIGGVHDGTLDALRGTGAAGIAVVSEVCTAADPAAAAAGLLRRWSA